LFKQGLGATSGPVRNFDYEVTHVRTYKGVN
jgi:hypothetical protein